MKPFIVSVPTKRVIAAYAEWKGSSEKPKKTLMADGWTLPSLHFEHLHEAQLACRDLAMISGSIRPFKPHDVLITEFLGESMGAQP